LRTGTDFEFVPYDPNRPLADQRAGLIGEYNGIAAASKGNPVPIWTDTRSGNQDTYVGVAQSVSLEEYYSMLLRKPMLIRPNPVRDYAVLEFELERTKDLTINIYNTMGNPVKKIYSGMLSKGLHRLNIETNSLPGGVYFLIGGGQMAKFVVLK
jgi:hypothetical protein